MKLLKKYWVVLLPFGLAIVIGLWIYGKMLQPGGIKGWLSSLFGSNKTPAPESSSSDIPVYDPGSQE